MIPAEHEAQLHELVDRFLEENAKVNLSAFRTPEQCWIGNVLDSLAFLELMPKLPSVANIMDIGTGGGFPLLPLAICLPQSSFVGIDATEKKVQAIKNITEAMQLRNIDLHWGRAETLGHDPDLRENADIVTARALAPLVTLLEYTSPFVKVGGRIVLWKSVTIDQELQDSLLARAELSSHLIAQHRYTLPKDWGERQLLIFEKFSALADNFPRAVGVPSKYPLS